MCNGFYLLGSIREEIFFSVLQSPSRLAVICITFWFNVYPLANKPFFCFYYLSGEVSCLEEDFVFNALSPCGGGKIKFSSSLLKILTNNQINKWQIKRRK